MTPRPNRDASPTNQVGSQHQNAPQSVQQRGSTVLIATVTPWEELPRLRHQVARYLAKSHRVVYLTFAKNWRARQTSNLREVEPNTHVWTVPHSIGVPWRFKAAFPWLAMFERHSVLKGLKSLPRCVAPPYHAHVQFDFSRPWLLGLGLAKNSAYICNDDFRLFAPNPQAALLIEKQIQECSALAGAVFITSEKYRSLVAAPNKTRLLIPGHSFKVPIEPHPTMPFPPMRVGFVGNIDKRLDFELIRLASMDSRIALHFIGNCDSETTRQNLLGLANLQISPPLYGDELFSWMASMHILWMPYNLPKEWASSVTTPNKTMSYFATGRPVVVCGLESAPAISSVRTYLYDKSTGLGDYFTGILASDTLENQRQRLSVAAEHTADKTFQSISQALGL